MDIRNERVCHLRIFGRGESQRRNVELRERLGRGHSRQTDREDEAMFAVHKLLDTYDHFLLEDLQEIKARIQPNVMSALVNAMVERRIPEEDRLLLA